MSKPSPGWYPHNSVQDWEHYWDGTGWTTQIRPKPKGKRGAGRSRNAPSPPGQEPRKGWFSRWLDYEENAAREADEARKKIVCQFCQEAGHVTVSHVKKNRRLSATRIVGTVATAGGSLLLTGVHKKGHWTRLTCSNCQMSWDLPD